MMSSVFANAGSLGSMTLLAALKKGGGDTLEDAKRLLLHHAVAALLNSTHPDIDYAFTTAQVIAWTSDMLTSTDRDAILGLRTRSTPRTTAAASATESPTRGGDTRPRRASATRTV